MSNNYTMVDLLNEEMTELIENLPQVKQLKAEIERLTEALKIEQSNRLDLHIQNTELQKQVDELKTDLENWKKAAYGYKYAEEQAVKDTAPVAINRFINQLHIDGVLRDEGDLGNELQKVKAFVLNRYYGVEVECNGW